MLWLLIMIVALSSPGWPFSTLFCASGLAAYMTGSMLFAGGGDMVG